MGIRFLKCYTVSVVRRCYGYQIFKVLYGKCCAEVLWVSDFKVSYGRCCAVASRCYVVFFRTGENIMVMYEYQEKV